MERAAQHRIAENAKALANVPRLAGDVLGKVWNAPNTAIGLGYGLRATPWGSSTGCGRATSRTTPDPAWS